MKKTWSFNLFESHCFFVAFEAYLDCGSKIFDAHDMGIWTHTFHSQNKSYDLVGVRPDEGRIMQVAPSGSDPELFKYIVSDEIKRLNQLKEDGVLLDCSHVAQLHIASLKKWLKTSQ